MANIPPIKIPRNTDGTLVNQQTEDRDKSVIENYLNNSVLPSLTDIQQIKDDLAKGIGVLEKQIKNDGNSIAEVGNFTKVRIIADDQAIYDEITIPPGTNTALIPVGGGGGGGGGGNIITDRLDISGTNAVKYKDATVIPTDDLDLTHKKFVDDSVKTLSDRVDNSIVPTLNSAIANKQDKLGDGLGTSYNDTTKTVNVNLGTGLKQGANNTVEVDMQAATGMDDYTIKQNANGQWAAYTIEYENNPHWQEIPYATPSPLEIGKWYTVFWGAWLPSTGAIVPATLKQTTFQYTSKPPLSGMFDIIICDIQQTTSPYRLDGIRLGIENSGMLGTFLTSNSSTSSGVIMKLFKYIGTGTPVIGGGSGGSGGTSTPFTINGGEATGMMDSPYEIAFSETSAGSKVWVAQNLYNFSDNFKTSKNTATGKTDIYLSDSNQALISSIGTKLDKTQLDARVSPLETRVSNVETTVTGKVNGIGNATQFDTTYVENDGADKLRVVQMYAQLSDLAGGTRAVYGTDELNRLNEILQRVQVYSNGSTVNVATIPLTSWDSTTEDLYVHIASYNATNQGTTPDNRSGTVVVPSTPYDFALAPYNQVIGVGANNALLANQAAVTTLVINKNTTTSNWEFRVYQRTSPTATTPINFTGITIKKQKNFYLP